MIQLLSSTRIAQTLPAPASDGDFGPVYWVAGVNGSSHIFKAAVYNSTGSVPVSVSFEGVSADASGTLTLLTAPDPYSYNDIGIATVTTTTTRVSASGNGTFTLEMPDYSVAVLEVTGGSYKKRNV